MLMAGSAFSQWAVRDEQVHTDRFFNGPVKKIITKEFLYEFHGERLLREKLELINICELNYDVNGRLTSDIYYGNNYDGTWDTLATFLSYDSNGVLTREKEYYNQDKETVITYTYDKSTRRLSGKTDDTDVEMRYLIYDKNYRIVERKYYDDLGAKYINTYEYDQYGRLRQSCRKKRFDPENCVIYKRNEYGHVVAYGNRIFTYGNYDSHNNWRSQRGQWFSASKGGYREMFYLEREIEYYD